MKYVPLFLLVVLVGSQAQTSRQKSPEEIRLPNGRTWNDVIAQADHESNLKDAQALAHLTAEIRDDIERGDKFVLSLKTLRKVEAAEKLLKDLRARMRKN
jgi:hypothetical protein